MILSNDETHIVSSFPNVDKGGIWTHNIQTGETRSIELSRASHLTLYPGQNDLFAAVHQYMGARVEISIHNVTEPEKQLARLDITGEVWRFEGDDEAWQHLPTVFVAYFTPQVNADANYHLITVLPGGRAIDISKLEWYDRLHMETNGGVGTVLATPDQEYLLYEIERDPKPLRFFHLLKKRITEKVKLSYPSFGVRTIMVHPSKRELWVTDTETLYRLQRGKWFGWSVKDSLTVQITRADREYVGNFTFTKDGKTCVIARPFRGDVVFVDTDAFKLIGRALTGSNPRAAVMLKDQRVLARDWNTGALMESRFAASSVVA